MNRFFVAQENRYTFTHYYGGRREDEGNHVHRDFAQDGGFLCPSGKSKIDIFLWNFNSFADNFITCKFLARKFKQFLIELNLYRFARAPTVKLVFL